MAKYNLFLGTASGSVGDVTMYVSGGTQVSRVRRRVIANPRSSIQVAQRVIIKTCAAAYSIMQPLVSQSFPRCSGRAANQSRFLRLNSRWLRQYLEAAEGGRGLDPDNIPNNDLGNILGNGSPGATINNYIISEGPLSFGGLTLIGDTFFGFPGNNPIESMTVSEFINFIGAKPGDQLTFVYCFSESPSYQGYFSDFQFASIILYPSDGDLNGFMFSQSLSANSNVSLYKPNPRNRGTLGFALAMVGSQAAGIRVASINGRPVVSRSQSSEYWPEAAGCILSRRVGRGWSYSNCQLIGGDTDRNPLNNAVASYLGDLSSSRYLDQALIV